MPAIYDVARNGAVLTSVEDIDGHRLVGRDHELALLGELVAQVAAGVGGTVLVEGEQGIGKTALLQAGLAEATAGCRVAWGTADELGQRFPLGLMVECLRAQKEFAEFAGTDDPGGPFALAGDPVVAGVERLLALADRLCAKAPVVLVAEDLQWADEASVLVWHRLSRAAKQMPLLVVGSLRPGPLREDLAGVRRGLAARGGTVISLGPLSAAEVADLVGPVVGGRLGRRLTRLVEQAGGNPLYARELAEALVRNDRVRVARGMAELAGEVAAVGMPKSLAEVIGGRLDLMGESAVGVLRWAAVLGLEFSATDLQVVTERQAAELMEVVTEALAAGVLVEAGPRLAFRHGLIRQVLYEAMPVSLRVALHLNAAQALAAAGAAAERVAAQLVVVPEIADSWVREWLAHTAPVLIYRAPQVAAELLRSALAQMAEDDPGREALEAALVQVAFLLARHEEVERVGRQALANARDPDRTAEITWLVARTLTWTSRPAEAASMVDRALAHPGVTAVHTARLRALHAMTLTHLNVIDEASQAASEALASAEAIGDRFAAGYAMHVLSTVSWLRSGEVSRLDHIDRALAVIGDHPQTSDLRLLLLSNKSFALDEMDRGTEALAAARQALALADRTGTPRAGMIRVTMAHHYYEAGQWDDALAELESATGLPGPSYVPPMMHALSALIALHRADRDTAQQHLAAITDEQMCEAFRTNAPYLFLVRSVSAEQAGRAAQAAAALAPCLDPEAEGDMPQRFMLLPPLVRLALAAGDAATAIAATEAAAAEAEREPLPARAAAARHCRGLLQADPAPVLDAANSYRPAGRPASQAAALEDAAVLFAERGDTQAARAAFTEAIRLYETMGAQWDIRRAGARLRPHGIRRGRRGRRARPATGWDALTPTETKIAYLVARGRSNPDIAAELWLTRNTVQTHVSHILAKLGARSRAEIIREAFEHAPAPEHTAAS
jgi:DNA-binding CsgD family transcriptional regulator